MRQSRFKSSWTTGAEGNYSDNSKIGGEFVYESPFSDKSINLFRIKVKSGDKYSILLDLDKLIQTGSDSISKVKFDLQFVPQLVMMNNAYLQVDPIILRR